MKIASFLVLVVFHLQMYFCAFWYYIGTSSIVNELALLDYFNATFFLFFFLFQFAAVIYKIVGVYVSFFCCGLEKHYRVHTYGVID